MLAKVGTRLSLTLGPIKVFFFRTILTSPLTVLKQSGTTSRMDSDELVLGGDVVLLGVVVEVVRGVPVVMVVVGVVVDGRTELSARAWIETLLPRSSISTNTLPEQQWIPCYITRDSFYVSWVLLFGIMKKSQCN